MLAKRVSRCSSKASLTLLGRRAPFRPVSATASRPAGGLEPGDSGSAAHEHAGHESHYDPPGGWLWGLRPGEKYEKEGWENLMIYGMYGSLLVAGIAYTFKPDTT